MVKEVSTAIMTIIYHMSSHYSDNPGVFQDEFSGEMVTRVVTKRMQGGSNHVKSLMWAQEDDRAPLSSGFHHVVLLRP